MRKNLKTGFVTALVLLLCVNGSITLSEEPEPVEAVEMETAEAEAEPVPEPTKEPVPEPVVEVTPEITEAPTSEITPEPAHGGDATAAPTMEPSADATVSPTMEPSADATVETTETPASESTPDPELTPDPSAEATEIPEEEILPEETEDCWFGVEPSDARGMAIPLVMQRDYIDSSDAAESDCGAACLTMVIAYFRENAGLSPDQLLSEACASGDCSRDQWDRSAIGRYAEQYGIHTEWVSGADAIVNALESGKPVIARMGAGCFGDGRYVVLRGIADSDKILVNDPVCYENCALAFPIETLLAQAQNDSAFMVCWYEAPTEPELIWGDVNASGSVDINDLQLLYAAIQDQQMLEIGDLDGDGQITQNDLDLLIAVLMEEA